jgi:uncharacterized membrane protein YvlD (DUF360 family)
VTRQIVRLILIALALYFIFPKIDGIQVHGSFVHVLIAAVAFAFLGWLVETLAVFASAALTLGTLGLALLILLPLWLFGFWLLPAFVLKLLADLMPTYLTISGWGPAILGGLVMLLIGIITGGKPSRYRRQDT